MAIADLMYLIDAPDDGAIEEYCYVPVASGPADRALDWLRSQLGGREVLDGLADDSCHLVYAGSTCWERPTAVEDGAGWVRVSDGKRSDYCPWEPCDPGADGAVEFYVFEAVELDPVTFEPIRPAASTPKGDGRCAAAREPAEVIPLDGGDDARD